MRFSIWPGVSTWQDTLEVAQHAEATGWDGVYVADHFMGDGGGFGAPETPTHEATAVLAALAGITDRVRLGSLVFGNTYRHPAVLAKWAATVDHVSGGRLVLGIGAGWQQNEHEQYGIRLPPPGERITRFEEACQAITGLLRQPTTSVAGEHYELTDALAEPKPVQQRLPLLIGGKGDRMLGVVARHADEWNMWGLAPVIAERAEVLARRCEAAGRDPGEIRRSAQALVFLTDDQAKAAQLLDSTGGRAAIAGTTEQVSEAVAAWQAVGVDEVIVPDFTLGRGAARLERMDAIIEQVAPTFR
ncbi:MAG: TIGR03560 family F420-dependent LLM class oxidoreductase [Acidimicrobiales bacterium]